MLESLSKLTYVYCWNLQEIKRRTRNFHYLTLFLIFFIILLFFWYTIIQNKRDNLKNGTCKQQTTHMWRNAPGTQRVLARPLVAMVRAGQGSGAPRGGPLAQGRASGLSGAPRPAGALDTTTPSARRAPAHGGPATTSAESGTPLAPARILPKGRPSLLTSSVSNLTHSREPAEAASPPSRGTNFIAARTAYRHKLEVGRQSPRQAARRRARSPAAPARPVAGTPRAPPMKVHAAAARRQASASRGLTTPS